MAAVLLVPLLGLAGCSEPDPLPEPVFEPYTDPQGDWFADSRHCTAYNVHSFVLATDLVPLVPSSWSFANPVAPEVRVLFHRCIEDFALVVSVPMKAGGPGDLSAPDVDFVLEVFTDSATDDWTQMGAPLHVATATLAEASTDETWTVEAEGGMAVRLSVVSKGEPGPGRAEVAQYGAGPDLVRSWGEEQASLTRPAEATVDFGPGSVLRNARDVPVAYPTALAKASPTQWWGAFNVEYRLGTPP
jgi:hypothetical protein